ncbi:aldehyde dehydrogenase [Haematobacter missouriensis]|uniref:Aldehyde dehydrogenase n=1 Tax=Haematobacter missouriensis TaxID=366616 RepID=A0ABX3ZNJ3_9RHOB|nr:molybdopterin cofactor-binding domain-containing protein [Haematobacter missouriensis]KFI32363.1 aldehyde dehydrogenase [Haematobacter missouriensis]OWJ71111.1 aldehyde dehydrogenase [Haematobacter missouriensis]
MGNLRLPPRGEGIRGLTRRGFLITMTAAGVTFGYARHAFAAMDPAQPDGVPVPPVGPVFEPTIWYTIDSQGKVEVNIIRAEMGQHVGTAIARILADELEVPWADVRITHVDSAAKWGMMVTGGSWSIAQSWGIYRQAGAAGRIALTEAAAARWNVSPADCVAREGRVTSGANSLSYGELISDGLTRAFTEDELKALPLKPVGDLRLVGQDVEALDIPNKITGKTIFGIDAKIDGAVWAAPILPPTRVGSKVKTIDDSAAKAVKGYQQTITLDDASGTVPGWVMVIASSHLAAQRAAAQVKVTWDAGPTAKVTEDDILDHARKLIADGKTGAILDTGDSNTDPAFAAAADKLEAEYTTATVLHFQLEPLNAAAFRNADGIWEIHTGNQWQSLILPSLAAALGEPEDRIVMRTYMLGGGFGRRLNGDYAVPVALASKALNGKPVKMIMTREQDVLFDSPRSASVQRVAMAFDTQGQVTAMEHDAAAGWPTQVMAPPALPKAANGEPYDPFAISGADHWYSVGKQKVRAISNDLANATFRPGWLRSVGPGWTIWAVESFMDEAAHKLGRDPLEFRLSLLRPEGRNAGSAPMAVGGASRQAAALRRAAEMIGWGSEMPPDSGIGLATSFGQERDMPTWVGCGARVHVDRKTGYVRVEKLAIATDAGIIVDPDGALAQTEGATLWGLSMALYEGTAFEGGNVRDQNLDTYTPLRMIDAPEMDIAFLPSTEAPVGMGEPATTVVAPAIGNAIFNAVGIRMRHLPITPDAILAALGQGAQKI